jgi:hypothetical protein
MQAAEVPRVAARKTAAVAVAADFWVTRAQTRFLQQRPEEEEETKALLL